MPATKSGYCNGSDLLLLVGGKAVGHCTTHKTTFNSETKDHAVKPVITDPVSVSLWKSKAVTGLSVSISFEGLVCYDETEGGLKDLLALWKTGQPVEVKGFERGSDATPYISGQFVFSSLDCDAPAQDDAKYTGQLENAGPVAIDEDKLTVSA